MTTSGITDWQLTVGDIVRTAMQELGALSSGEEPEAAELTDGMMRLNALLKSWSAEANMFRDATATGIVTGGTGAVTLPTSVRNVSTVRLIVSGTYQRALAPWTRDQYYSIPNRTVVGQPTAYYVSQQIAGDQVYIWPVSATDVTLHFDYSRTAETVTDPGETLDIAPEWQEVVYLGLASRMAGMFGATRLDPGLVAEIRQRGQGLYQAMLDRDRPDSYFFEARDGPYYA